MQQNASTTQSTTLAQKSAIVAGAALFFATPVIIFLRRKPGYRFLNPLRIIAMFLLLDILGGASGASGSSAMVMVTILFAWATLIVGLIKRQRRWKEIKNGVPWHTYSRGASWLSTFLPFSDSTVKRWFEPLAVLIAGVVLLAFVRYLGFYLIFAALCLFLFEAWDYEQSLNRMLDTLDSMVDAEVMDSNVQYYTQSEHPTQRPIEETAGIPTGIAPDLEVQIQRRRARHAASASTPGGEAF